ncbi:uncharacterized protein LOC129591467 [Paramacrobiotus metropolitanus]|uniref:uncharacterized protein LOC129591467 n=1 Tax=Paramacrobiotus metropolitanus TaxID=2943436 RepID=UPI00244638A1|nr:uncharacterized protein LOC129591467 [Paramacrobiotus metropolitanus]
MCSTIPVSILMPLLMGWRSASADQPSGCGNPHPVGFNDDRTINHVVSGGLDRYYAIYVPLNYNADTNQRRPLIFDFHGSGGSPQKQYENSMYYDNPKGSEYIAVYPTGIKKHWQGPSYADPTVNDLQFVTDLLAHIEANYCIDPNRIYASGKSNGGGFVDTLACSDHGDRFAAFAMAAAALYTDNELNGCPKRRAILEAHGEQDTTILYHGSDAASGGSVPDIPTWVRWWAERNGCDPAVDGSVSEDLGGYDVTSYSCGGMVNIVQHYKVHELGHCWPSSNGKNSDSERDVCADRSLDFTAAVVEFFEKWTSSYT